MSLPNTPRAVITGAAGGLGRAIALELARRRAHLVISDVNLEGCEETARLARDAGASSTKTVRCDVSRLEDVQALAAATEGTVDLVVNNAGVSSAGAIGELSLEDWRWTIDVDLWGAIYGCHIFVPRLRAQRRGHVLNVSSAAGLLCAPRMGAYNVAKAGVIALSETLASELAGTQVGVTVLCPTFIKTNIVSSGRFTDPKTRAMADKMISRGVEADGVARAALAAVEANSLYALPMLDARWGWRLKRAMPGAFHRLAAHISRRIEARSARHG
jgi:NAD(P)-dependent dehydrogenase (short-subunit alcohol dehydrogenase family)